MKACRRNSPRPVQCFPTIAHQRFESVLRMVRGKRMHVPRDERVARWFEQSERERTAAATLQPTQPHLACFHSQQAIRWRTEGVAHTHSRRLAADASQFRARKSATRLWHAAAGARKQRSLRRRTIVFSDSIPRCAGLRRSGTRLWIAAPPSRSELRGPLRRGSAWNCGCSVRRRRLRPAISRRQAASID